MKHSLSLAACVGASTLALVAATTTPTSAVARGDDGADGADGRYQVLVVGKTLGFRHSHIDETTNAVIALGQEHGFSVDVWDPPVGRSPGQPGLTMTSTPFTSADDLEKYETILFASPVDGTNDQDPARPRTLDDAELAALQGYMRDGGGFVGLHAATDAMHAVPWYGELTGGGARFLNHPAQQTATMRVESPTHPSTEMLPKEWVRFDEWYNFTANPRDDVHVLLTLDESTYTGGSMGADHPISWCHNFEGGRSWYEGAGHVEASYTDPLFLDHLLGGIEWTAGVVEGGGDCVTFPEVNGLNDVHDDGSRRERKLAAAIGWYLERAEEAHERGRHTTTVVVLVLAKATSHGLRDRALTAKIADLLEWQRGLARS